MKQILFVIIQSLLVVTNKLFAEQYKNSKLFSKLSRFTHKLYKYKNFITFQFKQLKCYKFSDLRNLKHFGKYVSYNKIKWY